MKNIAIIGAGLAGLSCARALLNAGHRVQVFEKSRGLGGRVATRRRTTDDGVELTFDHGAQFMTARGKGFRHALLEIGISPAVWGPVRHGDAIPDDALYVGRPGMSALSKGWVPGSVIQTETRIAEISGGPGSIELRAEEGEEYGPFDQCVLAVPVDQAIPLCLGTSMADEFIQGLRSVEVAPCWATLLAFEARQETGFDVWSDRSGETLSWVARNSSKPGRGRVDCWVLHATPEWSRRNLEREPETIWPDMLREFETLSDVSLPRPIYAAAHRWRFAKTIKPLGQPYIHDAETGISVCGDWCLGARVEAAYDSGTALADKLILGAIA